MASGDLFYYIDLLSVFTGALAGALVACRFQFDITGLFVLALVSGLGGGFIRDVLIASGPPLSLTEPAYLPTVMLATLISAALGSRIDRLQRVILLIDALALANYAVAGSLRALDAGMNSTATMLLGVITAVGGGLIREVLTGQTPTIFRRSEFYALAALGTCIAVLLMHGIDAPRSLTFLVGISCGMFLRLGSLRWGWQSWQPRSPD